MRTKIDNNKRTTSYSKRADNNKLTTIEKECPKCFHKKALSSVNIEKCSRCGYEHHRAKLWLK